MNLVIGSERGWQGSFPWHCIYEWEDAFASTLDLNIVNFPKPNYLQRFLNKSILNRLPFKYSKKNSLSFIISSQNTGRFKQNGLIPIFMDFYNEDLLRVIKETKYLPLFFVTNFSIYARLKEAKPNLPCFYMPLSVSDIWLVKNHPQKTIDVIQIGRRNPVLHSLMIKYCELHPSVEYAYQKNLENGDVIYLSTKNRNFGSANSRESFMHLLRSSKISLVSSPGAEGASRFGEGNDFITPRFYESAAAECYMLGRYTNNEEAQMLNIEKICPQINNFDTFCKIIDSYLSSQTFAKKTETDDFLKKNVTSVRARFVYSTFSRLGLSFSNDNSK